jgi:hypothetical protein
MMIVHGCGAQTKYCMSRRASQGQGAQKMPKNEMRQRFLTEEQAAALMGQSVRTLRNWRLFNKGPRFRKFSRSVRYDIRDLEAFFESAPSGGGDVIQRPAVTA